MTSYTARRVPVQLGPAAWNAILGPGPDADPLNRDTTADVVIIGAGFAGLSAARRLRQSDPTLDIVILEAGGIAEGAAGRNSGFMIDIPHDLTSEDYAGAGDDRALMRLNRMAQDFAAQAVEDYGIPAGYFDRAGKINGAASPHADAQNTSLSRHLQTLGEPFERLDARQMAEITGSHYYRSGLFTPGTVMLQPAGYIRGLAGGLRRDGVCIHANTPALGFRRKGQGWEVGTANGVVSADKVILTTNGHLESFGFAKRRLMHLFLFAVITPDLTADQIARIGGQPRWGITPSDPMGTTVRRIDGAQGGNRIVTRTCATLQPGMDPAQAHLSRARRVMQQKFDARFPALAGLQMEYAWAGHLCLSRNGVSVARELDTGVYSGCVQNGLGTARGTLTGIAAADACLGRQSEIRTFFEAQDDPTLLPPQPFQQIGANAVLRWKEWRPRAE